jgi:hypothetical protein
MRGRRNRPTAWTLTDRPTARGLVGTVPAHERRMPPRTCLGGIRSVVLVAARNTPEGARRSGVSGYTRSPACSGCSVVKRLSCVTCPGSSSSSDDTPSSFMVRVISDVRIWMVRSTPSRPPAMRP